MDHMHCPFLHPQSPSPFHLQDSSSPNNKTWELLLLTEFLLLCPLPPSTFLAFQEHKLH